MIKFLSKRLFWLVLPIVVATGRRLFAKWWRGRKDQQGAPAATTPDRHYPAAGASAPETEATVPAAARPTAGQAG